MNDVKFPYLLDSNSVFAENNFQRRFKIFILSPLLIVPSLVPIFLWHYCDSFVLARQINATPMFRVWPVLIFAETFQSFWFWTFILLLSLLEFWRFLTDYFLYGILLFLILFARWLRIILLSFLGLASSILRAYLTHILNRFISWNVSTAIVLNFRLLLLTHFVVFLFNTAYANT